MPAQATEHVQTLPIWRPGGQDRSGSPRRSWAGTFAMPGREGAARSASRTRGPERGTAPVMMHGRVGSRPLDLGEGCGGRGLDAACQRDAGPRGLLGGARRVPAAAGAGPGPGGGDAGLGLGHARHGGARAAWDGWRAGPWPSGRLGAPGRFGHAGPTGPGPRTDAAPARGDRWGWEATLALGLVLGRRDAPGSPVAAGAGQGRQRWADLPPLLRRAVVEGGPALPGRRPPSARTPRRISRRSATSGSPG